MANGELKSSGNDFSDEINAELRKHADEMDHQPPPPAIPEEVMRKTTLEKYPEIKIKILRLAREGTTSFSLGALSTACLCEHTLTELLEKDGVHVLRGGGIARAFWGPDGHSSAARAARALGWKASTL